MTHQPYEDHRDSVRLTDIVAADEAHPGIARQIRNGLGGLLVLLLSGLAIVFVVLWKSP